MISDQFISNFRTTVLGWHTRYMVRTYIQHLTMVTAGLLLAALCIDISSQVSDIISTPPAVTGAGIPLRILWFLALRSVDIGVKLFPVCCFLGTVSAEVALARGYDRLVILGSGRTPFQCAVPAFIVGISLGSILFCMDVYLRPASMAMQASARLGEDGRRFDRTPNAIRFWFAAANQIVGTKIDFGPPARLLNVAVYQVSSDGHLLGVATAEAATGEGSSTEWRMDGGRRWLPNRGPQQDDPVERMDIGLNPLWVTHLGISPMYLPQPILKALARVEDNSFDRGQYVMWVYLRYLDFFMPACMMLLACSLALALFSNGITFERILVLAVTGYLIHVLIRACALLGAQGKMAPSLAAFLAPGIATVFVLGVLLSTYLRGIGWTFSLKMLPKVAGRQFLGDE